MFGLELFQACILHVRQVWRLYTSFRRKRTMYLAKDMCLARKMKDKEVLWYCGSSIFLF